MLHRPQCQSPMELESCHNGAADSGTSVCLQVHPTELAACSAVLGASGQSCRSVVLNEITNYAIAVSRKQAFKWQAGAPCWPSVRQAATIR